MIITDHGKLIDNKELYILNRLGELLMRLKAKYDQQRKNAADHQ